MFKYLRHVAIIIFLSFCIATAQCQNPVEKILFPSGKPILRVFSNFHYDLSGNNQTAFEIQRAYLGYKYYFSHQFKGIVELDVCQENPQGNYSAFLKIASLEWKPNKKFKLIGGMIPPRQFKSQEKLWGYRYLLKSFQDEYRFGPSADLGILVEYQLLDFVTFDIELLNGEGYKHIKTTDGDFKKAIGITIKPNSTLSIRLYADNMNNRTQGLIIDSTKNQKTYGLFLAYNPFVRWRFGAEYNYQLQHLHISNHNLFGSSIYSTIVLNDQWEFFSRIDMLRSNNLAGTEEGWNQESDGNGIWVGTQYCPIEGVKLALNYRIWINKQAGENLKNVSQSFLYLNLEYKL